MIYFFQSLQVSRVTFFKLQVCTLLLFLIIASPVFSEVYRVKAGDTLLIAVVGQPEYTHSVEVRSDGRISYYGGDFDVAGKTMETVNRLIREFLVTGHLVSNPVVMVSPVLRERGVFVGGAVRTPGRYVISPEEDIGIYRAIALAGGMGENADRELVQVIRVTVAPQVEIYDLSIDRPYQDIRVRVNDLVFVMPLSVIEV